MPLRARWVWEGREMERIKTYLHADDPISRAGVASQLRPRPEVLVVEGADALEARVCLVIGNHVTDGALRVIRLLRQQGGQVVLVVSELDDAALVSAVEAGVA